MQPAEKSQPPIPEGGIVEITDGLTAGSRSIQVQSDGKVCEMFTVDLRDRGEAVQSAGGRLPF
jgi:hypothetical protein